MVNYTINKFFKLYILNINVKKGMESSRRDIEGLKFIFIFCLILFSFDFHIFNFGFIVVDLFFVIVGYITFLKLINKYNKDEYQFFSFLKNRFIKIFPLLFLSILISLFITIIYQTKSEFEFFVSNSTYSSLFISNFFFNKNQINFFLPLSNYLPLLQTWSLSIIFQFYMIVGIFFLIWKPININPKILSFFLLLLCLSSLGITQFGANLKLTYPFIENGDRFFLYNQPYWASFFNFNSRIWEFLLGGIFACLKLSNYNFFRKINNNKKIYNISFLIIIFTFILIKEYYYHPSINILPALIALSLILSSEVKKTFLFSFLSYKYFSSFGKLSLNLYLLHYPIMIFFKYYFFDEFEKYTLLILFLIFFISYLTNKYYEQFFYNNFFLNKKIYLSLISVTIFFIILNSNIFYNNNWIETNNTKYSFLKNKYPNIIFDKDKLLKERTEFLNKVRIKISDNMEKSDKNFSFDTNKKKILIIGNSQSQDFFLMLETNKDLFNNYEFRYYRMHLSNFLGITKIQQNNLSHFINDNLFKESDTIIISNNFRKYGQYSDDLDSLKDIKNLSIKFKKKLILTSNNIVYDSNIYPFVDIFFRYSHQSNKLEKNFDKELFKLINKKELKKNTILIKTAKELNIKFLDKIKLECNFKKKSCTSFDEKNHPIKLDIHHLTLHGAKFMGKIIFKTDWLDL